MLAACMASAPFLASAQGIVGGIRNGVDDTGKSLGFTPDSPPLMVIIGNVIATAFNTFNFAATFITAFASTLSYKKSTIPPEH